jgi:hypothetical protein
MSKYKEHFNIIAEMNGDKKKVFIEKHPLMQEVLKRLSEKLLPSTDVTFIKKKVLLPTGDLVKGKKIVVELDDEVVRLFVFKFFGLFLISKSKGSGEFKKNIITQKTKEKLEKKGIETAKFTMAEYWFFNNFDYAEDTFVQLKTLRVLGLITFEEEKSLSDLFKFVWEISPTFTDYDLNQRELEARKDFREEMERIETERKKLKKQYKSEISLVENAFFYKNKRLIIETKQQ